MYLKKCTVLDLHSIQVYLEIVYQTFPEKYLYYYTLYSILYIYVCMYTRMYWK